MTKNPTRVNHNMLSADPILLPDSQASSHLDIVIEGSVHYVASLLEEAVNSGSIAVFDKLSDTERHKCIESTELLTSARSRHPHPRPPPEPYGSWMLHALPNAYSSQVSLTFAIYGYRASQPEGKCQVISRVRECGEREQELFPRAVSRNVRMELLARAFERSDWRFIAIGGECLCIWGII